MKVKISEIAEALGLSRNTVSKALNNTGNVAPDTKRQILEKAKEMGYSRFMLEESLQEDSRIKNKSIAVFTREMPTNSHSGVHTLQGFERIISDKGYNLEFYIIKKQTIVDLALPSNFDISRTDAIVCIELFDLEYSRMLCELNIPKLFIDAPVGLSSESNAPDVIMMENYSSTATLVKNLIKKGKKTFGFIGDIKHCESFYERWTAFKAVTAFTGISGVEEYSILIEDSPSYKDPSWLAHRINELARLPEVFVCANDFIALTALHSLKILGQAIPADVNVTGFDDTPESRISNPTLSSAHISGDAIGVAAAEMILSRISNNNLPSRLTYIRTYPIFRESTED